MTVVFSCVIEKEDFKFQSKQEVQLKMSGKIPIAGEIRSRFSMRYDIENDKCYHFHIKLNGASALFLGQ